MPRYIDADKLEELCDIMAEKCGGIGESIWNQFRTVVEWSPTADVVERKSGEWLVYDILDYEQRHTGRKVLVCPFCEYLSDSFRSKMDYHKKLTNFCPNCGASMRKEASDGNS